MKGLKLLLFLLGVGLAGFAASATIASTPPSVVTTTALVCSRATPCTPEQCAQVGAHGQDCVASTHETTTVHETTTEQTTTKATTTTPPPGPHCPNGSPGGAGMDGQPGNDDCAVTTSATTATTTPPTQTTTPSTTTTTAAVAGTSTASTSPPSSNASGNLSASTTAGARPAAGNSLPFTGSRALVIATLLGIVLVAAGIALRRLRD